MIGEKSYKQPRAPIPHYSDKFKLLLEKSSLPPPPPPAATLPPSPPLPDKPEYELYRVRTLGLGAHASVHLVEEDKTRMFFAEKAIKKCHAR
jgi:hypothetical protein